MNATVASILSLVMTWTVESKSVVSASGTLPSDAMYASYACTYQKGDVRKGDTATIVFSNLGGITIERLDVYLKSNKSAGAGAFTVYVNGERVSSKSGAFIDWTGRYDNENYHPVTLLSGSVEHVYELSVQLIGTANSLHIEKYEIQYAYASPHTVTLMKGNEIYETLTETAGGAGVVLPSLPDEGDWKFTAWSKNHFYAVSTLPDSWISAGKYVPDEDVPLWAVYTYKQTVESAYVTELETGAYIYANRKTGKAVSGPVDEGVLYDDLVNREDIWQMYEIVFNSTLDTATIKHMATDTYIGYSGTSITAKASPWLVYHEGDKTAFYIRNKGNTYVLWPDYPKVYADQSVIEQALLITASDLSKTPTVLISTEALTDEPVITCHPEKGLGIDDVKTEEMNELWNEWMIPLGNYRLIIRNGKKQLQEW